MLAALLGCVASNGPVTPADTVDEVYELIDTRYALFGDKDVDWDSAYDDARAAVAERPEDLESIVVDMLETLRDGHVNLATPTNISITLAFLEERIPTWDEDLVERHVLAFEFSSLDGVTWAVPDPAWGYLRVDDFRSLPGRRTLDIAFTELSEAEGLVLDIRSNGGGSLAEAGRLIGRLTTEPSSPWHRQVTTGPAHDDLSAPVGREVTPVTPGFDGPLAVLVDGRTYSAANLVTFALDVRPDTVIVGMPTGGGAGSPTWYELANGWELRLPTIRLTGPDQQPMEDGLGVDVEVQPDPSRPTVDAMIEAAIEAL